MRSVSIRKRCEWVSEGNTLMKEYHDSEWGVPVFEDQKLFKFIVLESAQAGLSWETILKKREGYRKHFHHFDPIKIARMTSLDVDRIALDPAVIRHPGKIEATIRNAQVFLDIVSEFGTFSSYYWSYTSGVSIRNDVKSIRSLPVMSSLAEEMAKDLKKRGLKFFGPTICYAYMQATGMINDHATSCFRYRQVSVLSHMSH